MSRSFVIVLAVVVLGVVLPGCFREATRDVDCLSGSNGEKIHVTTKDGFRYWFSGGEYAVAVDSTGARVLIGTGKRDRGDTRSSETFEGIVPFAVIESVSVSESNPWLFFMFGVLAGIALIAVWVLVSYSGFRVG